MSHPLVVNRRTGEPYDIYVGRPGKWGNPFKVGQDGTREECIASYHIWLFESGRIVDIGELTGKRLGCWCAPLPCHADVLAKLANPVAPGRTDG